MLYHPMREVTAIREENRVRTLIPDRLRITVMNVFPRLTDPLNRPRFPIPLDRPKNCGVRRGPDPELRRIKINTPP